MLKTLLLCDLKTNKPNQNQKSNPPKQRGVLEGIQILMPEGMHRSPTGTRHLLTSKFLKLSANHRQPQRQLIGSDWPGLSCQWHYPTRSYRCDTILPEFPSNVIDLNIYNVPQDSLCIFSAKHDIVYIHIFILTLLSISCTHKCLMARDTWLPLIMFGQTS